MSLKMNLRGYLAKLAEQSRSGSLEWIRSNPTTFSMHRVDLNLSVSLQKVKVPRSSEHSYRFEIGDSFGQTLFSVNSEDDDAYYELLADLFEAAYEGTLRRGEDLLQKLLS